MSVAEARDRAIEVATKKAEQEIQKILLGLEHDTMIGVDDVRVDTRNFANCAVEIFLKGQTR